PVSLSILCSVLQCSPSFFSRLLRRPPSSPLFPYTTLFRSVLLKHALLRERRSLERRLLALAHYLLCKVRDGRSPGAFHIRRPCTDRKSTRLNSSHVKISYAVFCLKKKNIKHRWKTRSGAED